MTNPYITAFPAEPRSKLPNGFTDFYVNPGPAQTGWGAGSNTNDGLSPTTPMLNTQKMIHAIFGYFDFNGVLQSKIRINQAPNTTDTVPIHFAPHGIIGAQGGAAFILNGGINATIACTDNTPALCVFNHGIVEIGNLKVKGISATYQSQIYVLSGVEYISYPGGSHNTIGLGGQIHISGNIKVSGDAWSFLSGGAQGVFDGGGTITFLNDVNFSFWQYVSGIVSSWGNINIDTAGFTVTGCRTFCGGPSIVFSKTGNPNTDFPGNSDVSTWMVGGGIV